LLSGYLKHAYCMFEFDKMIHLENQVVIVDPGQVNSFTKIITLLLHY